MLRRLTYDGDYLMIDVIGATPAAIFWAAEPISNVCDWFKQRLSHIPTLEVLVLSPDHTFLLCFHRTIKIQQFTVLTSPGRRFLRIRG